MKDIPGYEGLYAATEDGQIWSYFGDGRFLKQHTGHRGYKQVNLRTKGKGGPKLVHRLIGITFIPNPESLPQINHLDGRKDNNSVSNLEWSTNQLNSIHAHRTGLNRPQRGEKRWNARLTTSDVLAIRQARKDLVPLKDLSLKYGVTRHTISRVANGVRWKHLPL
jgi:hypothetical protein